MWVCSRVYQIDCGFVPAHKLFSIVFDGPCNICRTTESICRDFLSVSPFGLLWTILCDGEHMLCPGCFDASPFVSFGSFGQCQRSVSTSEGHWVLPEGLLRSHGERFGSRSPFQSPLDPTPTSSYRTSEGLRVAPGPDGTWHPGTQSHLTTGFGTKTEASHGLD